MACNYDLVAEDSLSMHPLYLPKLSPCLDLKVFYVRVSNFEVDESTPDHLALTHIPLTPDTVLEVNGRGSSIYSECVSSLLRRDRVDKRSEEATFVSTDSIKMTGSVRFEVYDRDAMLLCGVLELYNSNRVIGEPKNKSKKWIMKCQSGISGGSSCLLKGKQHKVPEMVPPTIEVYVAGYFSGAAVILTKALQLGVQKKPRMKVVLHSIAECETTEHKKEVFSEEALQSSEYQDFKKEYDVDIDYNSLYTRAECIEGEDGELSWFNAGLRVGVGLGLGICLAIGIGCGLLVRTYQATARNFRRRLV